MEIVIDGLSVEMEVPNPEVTLKAVVEETEDYLFSVGKVAVALMINGAQINESDLEALESQKAQESDKLEFTAITLSDYVLNHLEAIGPASENLKKRLSKFSEQILASTRPTERQELVAEFTQFFDFWISFQKLFPEETACVKFGAKNFEDYFAFLQGLLKEIVESMEKNDFVLAADLIQYEVIVALDDLGPAVEKLKELVEKKKLDNLVTQAEPQAVKD